MEKRGFYIVKDSFFSDMNESFLKGKKFMPTQPNVIRLYKILKDRINNND